MHTRFSNMTCKTKAFSHLKFGVHLKINDLKRCFSGLEGEQRKWEGVDPSGS